MTSMQHADTAATLENAVSGIPAAALRAALAESVHGKRRALDILEEQLALTPQDFVEKSGAYPALSCGQHA